MKISTIYGIWMDDKEVRDHVTKMRAGTAEAECACDTCELYGAELDGYKIVLLPGGRLVYDARFIHIKP